MKRGKRFSVKVFTLLMLAMIVSILAPGAAKAADEPWMTDHDIPAYQKKNMYETETTEIKGITVVDKDGGKITDPVHFVIFNSTKQEIQEEVASKDGVLPTLKLINDHNYTIYGQDENYKMDNVYVWVNKGVIKNIKDIRDTEPMYPYGKVESLVLEKRDTPNQKPEDDRRVDVELTTKLRLSNGQAGGVLANVDVIFTSDVETVRETSSDPGGKVKVRLLEDVNYMVSVENAPDGRMVEPFPLAVKDKSEYDAGKYPYDHTSCLRVGATEETTTQGDWDQLWLINSTAIHDNDTTLTNTNYGDYKEYADIAGKTTITGANFKDCLVLDHKLDKSLVKDLDVSADYDVIDIKVVNPHRWEFCKFATGDYKITEGVAEGKNVKQVSYLKDGKRVKIDDFQQSGSEITFKMDSLSLYPIVVEYGEESEPEFDPTKMTIKVVDEKGSPVEGLELYLKSEGYGEYGNLKPGVKTDADGKLTYECGGTEMDDDEYSLLPVEGSEYTCDSPCVITFGLDENWDTYIATIDGEEYAGQEVTLTVKSTTTEPEPEPEPEFDPKKMTIKVVGEDGKAVEGLELYLQSKLYPGIMGDLTISGVTDEEGKIEYTCSNMALASDTYSLLPVEGSDYTCEKPVQVTFASDEAGGMQMHIATIDGEEYTGQEVTLTVKSAATEPEPEPEPEITNTKASVDAVGMDGGKAKVTVSGTALPETLYYSISYVTGESRGIVTVVEGQEVKAQGTDTERSFEVTLPSASDYPDATAWQIGVAVKKDGEYKLGDSVKVDETILTAKTEKALEDAIAEADGLDSADYTKETWDAYAKAVEEARSLTEKKDATETEYQEALDKIAELKAALAPQKEDPEDPKPEDPDQETPVDPDKGQGTQNPDGSQQGQQATNGTQAVDETQTAGAAQTSDTAPILPIAGIMVLSLAVIAGVRIRTRIR